MNDPKDGVGPLHHVTAMSGDPVETLAFYRDVLGLRLVKKTVNFDDPSAHHLYFGDGDGSPGTTMTFFPWPLARQGRRGIGQCTTTQFSVPEFAVGFWSERLRTAGVTVRGPTRRFGADVLEFEDPHGLLLELVASAEPDPRRGWEGSDVPAESRIRGFFGVTLMQRNLGPTAQLLEFLGFELVESSDDRHRFRSSAGGPASSLDVLVDAQAGAGQVSKGTVHHVAFRLPDDATQMEWSERLLAAGIPRSPVMDRQYFRSVYFSEPGGVLFELATDGPGFAVDEPTESLGRELKLPPHYEFRRSSIESALPPLDAERPVS